MKYSELVAQLALPTPEQTARFADHVADNHSWYKHLPFFPPGASFVFFLNPNAGRGVREAGGIFSVYDLESADYFHHQSRLATAEYLSRFGHWDYWVDENPRVPEAKEGPWIYRGNGDARELLPSKVKQHWSCRFTAFLKPGPILRPSEFHREREAFEEYARQHPINADIERYGGLAREVAKDQDLGWGNKALLFFMEAEAGTQRARLLQMLQAIHQSCADS